VTPNLRRGRGAGGAVLSRCSGVEQATQGQQEPAGAGGPDGEPADASEPWRPPRRSRRGGGGVSGERHGGPREDVLPAASSGAGARGGARLVAAERPIAIEVSGLRALAAGNRPDFTGQLMVSYLLRRCGARESGEWRRCLEKGKEREAAAAKGMEGWRSFGKVLCF
jgi:hypothetical protein